jgi:hypothetical protein
MYRVRHWNHDRDEMIEEFVEALDQVAIDKLRFCNAGPRGRGSPSVDGGPRRRTEVRAVMA